MIKNVYRLSTDADLSMVSLKEAIKQLGEEAKLLVCDKDSWDTFKKCFYYKENQEIIDKLALFIIPYDLGFYWCVSGNNNLVFSSS